MSKVSFLFLFVCETIFIVITSASHHCPYWANEKIHECVKPVQNFAKTINQQDSSLPANATQHKFGDAISLPKVGGQVFQDLCSLIRNFNQCVAEPREQCPKHIMLSLIDASYGFLCNEGYEECLMELDHKPSVKHCHDETLADIEKANEEVGITMPVKLDRMCDALNYFSGCVRTPIRHNCGMSAWAVIFRVLRDTTRALLPNCQFTGQSRKLFLTTEMPPFRAYKPTIIQITPRISGAATDGRTEEHIFVPNRKVEFRATRTQGFDADSVYYSSRKSTSKHGETPSPEKLAAAASSHSWLQASLCLALVYIASDFSL